jgi:hypothetical protein
MNGEKLGDRGYQVVTSYKEFCFGQGMKVADSIKRTYKKTEWRDFIKIIINFKVLQKVK